jgi:hypothetical protein
MAKTRVMECGGRCGTLTKHRKCSYADLTDSTVGKVLGRLTDKNPLTKAVMGSAYECTVCGYGRGETFG